MFQTIALKSNKVIIFFWTLTLLFGTISCDSFKKEESQNEIPELEITQPIQIDTAIYNEYVADIHAFQNVEVRARVKGYLDKVNTDEGKSVQKGQVLFTINNLEYKTELLKSKAILEQSDAEVKASEIEFQNTRLLVEKKVISNNQLLIAKAKLDALKAKRDEARAHVKADELKVDFSTIKAPFDGVIDRIPFKAGSLIDDGSLLTTISDTRDVFAYFNVNENEYLEFAKMRKSNPASVPVELKLSNGEIYSHKGQIETIEAEIDKSTGNIAFRAKFPNPEKLLKHGASGRIIMQKNIKGFWLIPQKSVFEIQERSYVFVMKSDGSVQMKKLNPAYRIEHYYLVKEGFQKTDNILIEGVQSIKQGQKIKGKLMNIRQVVNDLK
jgi:membrane fusion protein (multidrug efflux system)